MTQFADLYWNSADGLRLHARDYAPAADTGRLPVICLHGLTRNARDFAEIAPKIAAAGRRTLVAEFRGRGQSAYAADPMTYWPTHYAGDILAMLDAAGIERALFIGTSLGGLVTLVLASLAPQRVAGAVLNDVGPVLSPAGLSRIASYAGFSPEVSDWAGAAAYAKALNGVAFPDYTDTDWDAFARRIFLQDDKGAFRLDYDPEIAAPFRAANLPKDGPAKPAPDLTPLFVNLAKNRPLLLVRGALSDLLDAPLAQGMREAAPMMAYAEVPGVGHAPTLSEPSAWSAIETWLATAP